MFALQIQRIINVHMDKLNSLVMGFIGQWYSGTVVQCYSGTVLQCYSVTVLQCYSVTVLQCSSATVLQCYSNTHVAVGTLVYLYSGKVFHLSMIRKLFSIFKITSKLYLLLDDLYYLSPICTLMKADTAISFRIMRKMIRVEVRRVRMKFKYRMYIII